MIDRSYIAIGSAIRNKREAIGMTQETLAQRVGLSRTSVTNIERGRQALLVHQLLKFSQALATAPASLLPDTYGENVGRQSEEMPADMRELLARLDPRGAGQ